MKTMNYQKMYEKINKTIGELTPLKADCGVLCNKACCKGDESIGMRLFPFEETALNKTQNSVGETIVICNGICDRNTRPLACKIFPFFPTIDEKGKIFVELDYRGKLLCPMIDHCDEIIFNNRFLKAIKKVGKILAKDEICRKFLYDNTDEIDTYIKFLK